MKNQINLRKVYQNHISKYKNTSGGTLVYDLFPLAIIMSIIGIILSPFPISFLHDFGLLGLMMSFFLWLIIIPMHFLSKNEFEFQRDQQKVDDLFRKNLNK